MRRVQPVLPLPVVLDDIHLVVETLFAAPYLPLSVHSHTPAINTYKMVGDQGLQHSHWAMAMPLSTGIIRVVSEIMYEIEKYEIAENFSVGQGNISDIDSIY